MLLSFVRASSRKPAVSVAKAVSVRGMASEKEMRDKIASTANIAKITKSMKMVAAARMRKDEELRDNGIGFAGIFPRLFTPPEGFEGEASEPKHNANMYVVCGSDRGLCGGINSVVAKEGRGLADAAAKDGKDVHIATLGEKARSQMHRTHPENVVVSMDEICKVPLTFDNVLTVAQRLVNVPADNVHVVHNTFISMIAYEPIVKTVESLTAMPAHLTDYDVEPEDKQEALQNLFEFSVAGSIHSAITDGNAAEQSARMAAMDNASKNADEMIEKFTLAYNRLRQAKITTELIEIISGAESLKTDD